MMNCNWVRLLSRYSSTCGPVHYKGTIRHADASLRTFQSHSTAYACQYKGYRNLVWWKVSANTSGLEIKSSCRQYVSILSPSVKQNKMECQKFRKDVMEIFHAAVESVYPPRMVRNAVTVADDGSSFTVDGQKYPLNNNVSVVGFGKAVSGMARALDDLLGNHVVKGVISIPYGSQDLFRSLGKEELCVKDGSKIQVFEGARNNLPDEEAHMAAMDIEKLADSLGQNDILFVLISGGGSALLPSPMEPVTLQEEQDMTRLLSLKGASIQQLNILRQNLETLKGGGLAQKARPASVISLILSDVIEDKLDLISSGPTTPLLSSPRQSLQILEMLNLKDKVPPSIISCLQQRASAKKTGQELALQQQTKNNMADWEHVHNVVIGSNSIATEAALAKALALGHVAMVLTNKLQGDCHKAAEMFVGLVKFIIYGFGDMAPDVGHSDLTTTEIELIKYGFLKADLNRIVKASSQAYNSRKGICIICGGETTVDVTGSGKGGRNQEMALAFSILYDKWLHTRDKTKVLDKFHVEFLSAGTDGQDGPTDAAGAVVNKNLIPMAISSKLNANEYLENNDSYMFFRSLANCDNHVLSGLTGTNVMDIQVLLMKYLQ